MASSSSDEGEIRDPGLDKATTSPQMKDTSVDRQHRTRSRYSPSPSLSIEDSVVSALRRSSERRLSPRGSKRNRDDDHYSRNHRDSRRFKGQYEDRPTQRRSQQPYEDLDREGATPAGLRYDDGDRNRDRRSRTRTRSRSPYRASREAESRGSYNTKPQRDNYSGSKSDLPDRPRMNGYGNHQRQGSRDQSVSKRADGRMPTDLSNGEAKFVQGYSQKRGDSYKGERDIERSHPPAEEPPSDTEPLDEAALIEQRRKRREAIKAKYKGSATATPLMVQALQIGDRATPETRSQSEQDGDDQTTRNASPDVGTPSTPKEIQDPSAFAALNDQELANDARRANPEDGPSAADYDPTMDMKEDRFRDDIRHTGDVPSSAYDETKPTTEQEVLLPASEVEEKPKKSKDDFDMFADDDDDDMFAEEPETAAETTRKTGDSAVAVPIPEAKVLNVGMLDNWDDAEGYYKVILGELLDGRYHVQANLGKGMFSGVVRATDITTKRLVAVKMIRANETMRKAGMKEIEILQKLMSADVDDKKHMIRLERHFEHKGHLCMVFEHLSINLREVLKKFGRDVGINIRAVRVYAQQMFLGLTLMRKCNILHADLKPDNILVTENRSMLKICDLGSASDASDNEITPYLVSRFYRAPEIILGMPYDFAIDIWSVGCTLYELYTGKILFVGRSNNQMLRSIMECRGKFTTKMLRKAQFAHMHFDEQTNFLSVEQDKLSGRDTVKTLPLAKPTRDLRTRLATGAKGLPDDEMKELNLFIDLLDKCLALNPEKRCTPAEALKHPFLNRPVGR
ncbi:U4/U6 small nuclear ribonucleoprotein prp4 [Pseudogymnoascus verrucosus]|uniref:non-specific serine/threonine protein kinase n=1 Tax=Pseudogymnoascus verrucosus TaxID=342668 RepID=A0A2P2SXM3_9PEZI|nr:U4/U6 small nuclear ribonucleoprotein prp4 [Pseudogymnoascus verrucosus]OBU01608.1 U4/U6 small nuclear ribonucleoprotein prp4 [Pseudogymnoascus verrucosus]